MRHSILNLIVERWLGADLNHIDVLNAYNAVSYIYCVAACVFRMNYLYLAG